MSVYSTANFICLSTLKLTQESQSSCLCHVSAVFTHMVIKVRSQDDVSDWELAAAPVTEFPRLSRFSRAVRVSGTRCGWQLSPLDPCREETERGCCKVRRRDPPGLASVSVSLPARPAEATHSVRQRKITDSQISGGKEIRASAHCCYFARDVMWGSVISECT